jgi:hypothetical protein
MTDCPLYNRLLSGVRDHPLHFAVLQDIEAKGLLAAAKQALRC